MRKSSKRVIPKKRGRPATGNDPVRAFRMSDEFMASVDAWAASRDDKPSRAEAIRRLVEIGLAASKPAGRPSAKIAEKAKQLAAKAIDGLIDSSAPAEEKAIRTRRLLKGPEEFREVRVDRAKEK